MIDAAPTMVALRTDSMWAVIVAVSFAALVLVLFLRRVLNRPGGLLSGILLTLPLLLPLLAAVLAHDHGVPDVGFLVPASSEFIAHNGFRDLVVLPDTHSVGLYALKDFAGSWVLVVGGFMTVVMFARRFLGALAVSHMGRRSRPLSDDLRPGTAAMVRRLAGTAGLKLPPLVLVMPSSAHGVFATGGRKGRILIAQDLLESLDDEELEATLAHEIAHLAAWDPRLVSLAGMLRDVVVWNPIAHLAYRRLTLDRELEADRRAAHMTGRPLALASSLIKVCEQMMRSPRLGAGPVVGLWRGRGRLGRRIQRLMALADGSVREEDVSRAPFVAAVTVAAVLTLQIGVQMTTLSPSAVAVVWGVPHASSMQLAAGSSGRHSAARPSGGRKSARERQAQEAQAEDRAFPPSRNHGWKLVIAMRGSNGPSVIQTVSGPRSKDQPPRNLIEEKMGWRALPLVTGEPLGGIGVYRIDPQTLQVRTLPRL